MRDLDPIFSPKSVAVVGASTVPGKVGHDIFVNILKGGFQGTLYPVNPKAKSISSVRAYASIAELPEAPDLGSGFTGRSPRQCVWRVVITAEPSGRDPTHHQ